MIGLVEKNVNQMEAKYQTVNTKKHNYEHQIKEIDDKVMNYRGILSKVIYEMKKPKKSGAEAIMQRKIEELTSSLSHMKQNQNDGKS